MTAVVPVVITRLPSVATVLMFVLLCGCVPKPRPIPPVDPARVFRMDPLAQCATDVSEPIAAGTLSDELVEASGIVASPTHAGVLWSHNDGDDARLYAMTTTGASLGSIGLPGIDVDDIEDLAAAPCPDLVSACLYLCDCGDNDLDRSELVVLVVLEPDVAPDRPLPPNSAAQQVWRFPLLVPQGPANVEAFIVTPDATAIVLFEKERNSARVLRLPAPWTPDVLTELQLANRITAPGPDGVVTGAAIHPSGARALLRTYVGVFEARIDVAAGGLGVAALDGDDFVELFRPDEPQGEAVAYDETGTGIWTVSESPDRTMNQPLHHAVCE